MESLILPSKSPLQQQQLSEPDKSTPAQPTYQYQMKRRMVRIFICKYKINPPSKCDVIYDTTH